jgi:tetratricopeptide (TPR) repeat protein
MIKNIIKISFLSLFFFLISAVLFNPVAFCQQSPSLQDGIDQYKAKNYDAAIASLEKARAEDPSSSVAAFFLGLAYKQTFNYEKALGHFRDAVTLTPRIKEALIELVDVAMQLGEIEVAKEWIGVAEEADILPAKTAFLKGLILREEGKNKEAEEAFKKAKSIDPSIAQASDIQIALGNVMERDLGKAKESFESAITRDPQSDLAGFARQYLATVEQRLVLERPFRYTLSLFTQYDDNMILKPTDESLSPGPTNESSGVLNSSFRVNYVPVMKGKWLFNAQYALFSSVHQKNVHTHDSFVNSISINPGYNFGTYAINLATNYSYALVRSPGYKKYSGSLSIGPVFRYSIKGDQLLEIFAGYTNNEYFKPALSPEEDRNSNGFNTYLSWIWLFKKDSFLNLKYQFRDQNADGSNWDRSTHDFSANLITPLAEKVKFQLAGSITDQDYKNIHSTTIVRDLPPRSRKDTSYIFSGGVTWDFYKDMTLVGQYSHDRTNSNIGAFDYSRNTYTVGMEYRF